MNEAEPKRRTKRGEYSPRGTFKIIEFKNPSDNIVYCVTGKKLDGARVRENFKTHDEALARKQTLEIEAANIETASRTVLTKLTPKQVSMAEAAFARLPEDDEMPIAIEWWVTDGRNKALAESPWLSQAVTDFKAWLDSAHCGLRDLTKDNLKIRVDLFAKSGLANGKRLHEITADAIFGYLEKRDVAKASKDNDRRALSRFFGWCMDRPRHWIKTNPARKELRERRRPSGEKPAVLSLAECQKLLKAAESHRGGRLLPYVAVSLFGGLRPFEAARLRWIDVNLADREISLAGNQTKTGRPRVVAICDTLAAWLESAKGKEFFPSNWRKDFDAIKEASGLVTRHTAKSKDTVLKKKKGRLVRAHRYWKNLTPVNWSPDIMRHTAISHYFRKTGSYGQTAEQFGNSEAIIKNHYQGRVSSEEAKAFYALLPAKGRKQKKH